jgi:glycosyltransferase involved in cell wall biosynthesis
VPNGVDIDYFTPQGGNRQPGQILFLGPTYMYPNRDAVQWFLETMWEGVRQGVPNAELHLVGKNPTADRERFCGWRGVRCHGYVPDVRPHLAAATCSIVPIRVGGGTRLKILDSWAAGTAVVSTTVGCEGLEARDSHNILIRDDPRGFAEAVVQVLTDADLRRHLEGAGRATAEGRYSWRAIGDGLIAAYQELLTGEAANRPAHRTD